MDTELVKGSEVRAGGSEVRAEAEIAQESSSKRAGTRGIDEVRAEGSEVRAEAEIAQESSSKRAGTELEQESIKKQKLDEDKETAELQRLIEVVPDKEEVAIDAIPLETKPPSIVDYKIHKEGKKTYYQIIRADGSSKMYYTSTFIEEAKCAHSYAGRKEISPYTCYNQRLIEVVPDKEEVAIDAIPLATNPPSIVDYKIHKEGKKTYYQIIRADEGSNMYLFFSHMLKSFDREDLETLFEIGKS
ncbi:hypothetical protein Tco_1564473 [Tanacetum coccineum]